MHFCPIEAMALLASLPAVKYAWGFAKLAVCTIWEWLC